MRAGSITNLRSAAWPVLILFLETIGKTDFLELSASLPNQVGVDVGVAQFAVWRGLLTYGWCHPAAPAICAKARALDMAEVAYALKDALARTKASQKAFSDIYRGTTSGARLRRGLGRLLADDPETMAFFDALILSDDR
jgi:hypothetical protein